MINKNIIQASAQPQKKYFKHHLTPHNKQRQYLKEYLRLPLHRKQIIKKINQTTLSHTNNKSLDKEINSKRTKRQYQSVFGLEGKVEGQKEKRSNSYGKCSSFLVLSQRQRNLSEERTKKREALSLKTMNNSLGMNLMKKSICNDSKEQDEIKNRKDIKTIIRKMTESNKTTKLLRKVFNRKESLSQEQFRSNTCTNLRSTEQYFYLRSYYEKKYTS